MPYISRQDRELYDSVLNEFGKLLRENGSRVVAGGMNYLITKMISMYLQGRLRYSMINEVIGIIECVKQELYRRVAFGYEDKKKEENGDVY
jgi:hypothetical protein